MRVNLKQVIKTPYNTPIIIDGDETQLTLGKAIMISLETTEKDSKIESSEKYTRYGISKLLVSDGQDNEFADFDAEQIVFIKQRVGEVFISPLTMGYIWDILEGKINN